MPEVAQSAVLSTPAATTTAPAAATTAAAATTTGAATAAGASNAAWYDDAHKALVEERKWASPNDVIASYQSLEKFRGLPADRIIDVQNPDWGKLGVPKDAAGYELALPEGGNKDMLDWFTGTALEAKVPKGAAATMYAKYNEFAGKAIEAEQAALTTKFTTDEAAVTAGWGAQTQENAETIRRVAALAGWDLGALREVAMYSPLGVKGLYDGLLKFGSLVKEEGFRGGEGGRSSGAMDPATAKASFMAKPKDWTAKAAVKGSAEWNEHQDLQAGMAGMTRAEWDRMMGAGAVQQIQAAA